MSLIMNIKFKGIMPFLTLIFFGLFSITSHAAVFSIVPKAGTSLPTTVAVGGSVKAYYTVTNTTGSSHAGNYVKYLPLNVTQVTSDGAVPDLCSTTFLLAANASCTLELKITGAVNGNDPNPQDHLFVCLGGCTTCCAGTNFPLNVSTIVSIVPTVTTSIPVDGSTNVSSATAISVTFSTPMDTSTLVAANIELRTTIGSTLVTLVNPIYSPDGTTVTFSLTAPLASDTSYQIYIPIPANITSILGVPLDLSSYPSGVVSTFTTATYITPSSCIQAFILNNANNSITECIINDTPIYDGSFYSCSGNGQSTTGISLDNPTAMTYDEFAGLSVTNASGSTPLIIVNATGFGSSPPYSASSAGVTNVTAPTGIASPNLYGYGFGYIANGNGTLTYCSSDWSGCNVISPPGYPTSATALAISPTSTFSGFSLFTANTSANTISICTVDSTPTVTSCADAGGTGFNQPTGLSISLFGNPAYALITNSGNNTVELCTVINETTLIDCTITGSNFNQPSSVFEYPFGVATPSYAYITNKGDNSVTVCTDTNGVLTNCNRMTYGFDNPSAIVVGSPCA